MLAPGPGVVPITLVVLGMIVAVPLYFIVRFLRAYERRSTPAPPEPSSAMTIAALQEEVDHLRAEVARLTEAQDFTTRLLHDRPLRELNPVGTDEPRPTKGKPER